MAYTRNAITATLVPSEEEREAAKASLRLLAPNIPRNHTLTIRIVDEQNPDHETALTLPTQATQILIEVLLQMAEGNAITLIPLHAEITTQQAAAILNISRPSLIRLLKEGAIPFRNIGTHRRILLRDLIAYQERTAAARTRSLDELAAISQELGLGY
ncbi:helix-turn-helix domain-containing protein [Candidatus Viridilinea mediisalina]|uniref:Helix-turn-helix domain-containing protein n=1 Tax=Candidatus Viridilinea mediisalina TaxID=2024553 RepID=A0A2A6RDR2_9CHLR|nr:helix-turn-helix domain-containing protein [Candidatus Viridilinea mediisalina]PDW00669.1 hypothetical protein CJ255_20330 [Candidatus Viridilinea mediisalina]